MADNPLHEAGQHRECAVDVTGVSAGYNGHQALEDVTFTIEEGCLAGLDATAQHDLLELLERLRTEGKTLFVATHDLSCVAADFDHAVLINKRVIAFGRPQDVFTEEKLSEAFQRHLFVLPQGTTIVGP